MDTQYEFLSSKFLEAMNDIGRYGFNTYGDHIPTYQGRKEGERWTPYGNAGHARLHFNDYRAGVPHEHFGTQRHQLAAVAYNALMEFMFAGLENEK